MFSIFSAHSIKNKVFLPIILVLALTLVAGCSVKLISDYDELIDRYATELQSSIETFLIKMERLAGTPGGTYAANTGFYDELQGTLTTLALRAETMDDNDLVVKQIALLQENVENLRQLHQNQGDKGLTKPLLEPMRVVFNTQFKAIIKLQKALKRGETAEN